MKFQETKQSTIKLEYNKYSLLMNHKKYNTDSKIKQKDSIRDKNKKTRQTSTQVLFHRPATNSDIYAKSEKSRLYILDVQDGYNELQKIHL
jgi:hypothetical protein